MLSPFLVSSSTLIFFKLTKITVLFKMQDLDAILIFQSQLIIPISPKVKNNILRKYHLLLRASTGNLHFHFLMYYLGEEMTTSLSQSQVSQQLQSSRQKESRPVSFLLLTFMEIKNCVGESKKHVLKDARLTQTLSSIVIKARLT